MALSKILNLTTSSLELSLQLRLNISSSQRLLLILLLLIGDSLQSEEVLSRLLIKLLVNVVDCEVNPWNDDILERVYTSVCDLNDLVESDELSLQRGDIDHDL